MKYRVGPGWPYAKQVPFLLLFRPVVNFKLCFDFIVYILGLQIIGLTV